jgi:hypothetical protein
LREGRKNRSAKREDFFGEGHLGHHLGTPPRKISVRSLRSLPEIFRPSLKGRVGLISELSSPEKTTKQCIARLKYRASNFPRTGLPFTVEVVDEVG